MLHFLVVACDGRRFARINPKKAIEPDHELFAQKLGIALIEEPDFELYGRAMLYPSGSKVRSEIDPARNDHLALVLEAAGVFAVALATCVGIVFHQYLQTRGDRRTARLVGSSWSR